MGLLSATSEDRWTVVRICIAALHAMAGTLFLVRRCVTRGGSATQIFSAMPAVVLSGLAFSYAQSPSQWSSVSNGLFVAGTAIAVVAFFSLSRNFSVLPAVRGLTTGGLYRIVRHPAYTGELLLVFACALSRFDLTSCGLFAVCVTSIAYRINVEERLLGSIHDSYAVYKQRVRYRLVPWVW